jgi:hypothetical protein
VVGSSVISNLKEPIRSHYGRIYFADPASLEILTYSWLDLDLHCYLGQSITPHSQICFFYCNKYKRIYLDKRDLDYLHNSALRHKEYKTAKIFKSAIDDVVIWAGSS